MPLQHAACVSKVMRAGSREAWLVVGVVEHERVARTGRVTREAIAIPSDSHRAPALRESPVWRACG